MFSSNIVDFFYVGEGENILRLNGWEVTEAQMEAIPNGFWIGSEVCP